MLPWRTLGSGKCLSADREAIISSATIGKHSSRDCCEENSKQTSPTRVGATNLWRQKVARARLKGGSFSREVETAHMKRVGERERATSGESTTAVGGLVALVGVTAVLPAPTLTTTTHIINLLFVVSSLLGAHLLWQH